MQHNTSSSVGVHPIPIIAIDGTTASGKGSLARKLALYFGFHYLNSGALYRLTAYLLKKQGFNFDRYHQLRKEMESSHIEFQTNAEYVAMEHLVIRTGATLSPLFLGKQVIVLGADVWPIISTQEYGNYAAKISPTLALRKVIYDIERNSIKAPGLVAEGRDMTSTVFVDAMCKIYLDAHPETRATRRHKEEKDNQAHASFEDILREIHDRDHKDKNRHHGPLIQTADSYHLDNTALDAEETFIAAKEYCESVFRKYAIG